MDDGVPVVGKEYPGGQQELVFRAALAYDSPQTCKVRVRQQLTKKHRSGKTKRHNRDVMEHYTPREKPQSLRSRDSALPLS